MFDDPDIVLRFFLFVLVPVLLAVGLWYWVGPERGGRGRRRSSEEPASPPSPGQPPRATESPSVPVPIILDRREAAASGELRELAQRDQSLAEMRQRFDKVVTERNDLMEQLGAATQQVRALQFDVEELRAALAAVRAEVAERDEEIERLRLHEKALDALRRDTRGRGRELVALGPGASEPVSLPPSLRAEAEDVVVMDREAVLRRDREPGDGARLDASLLARVAMPFDGSTVPRVSEPDFEGFSGAGFTVELWARPQASRHAGTLLSYVAGRKSQVAAYVGPEGDLELHIAGQSTGGTTVPLELDAWQHLAICWEAETGGFSVYVDGEELYAGELARGALIPPGGRLLIGQDANPLWDEATPEMSFRGQLAEVRIWRYVREGAAIALDQARRARGGPGVTIWRVADG